MMGDGDEEMHWESDCANKDRCMEIIQQARESMGDSDTVKTASKVKFEKKQPGGATAGAAKSFFVGIQAHYYSEDDYSVFVEPEDNNSMCNIALPSNDDPEELTSEEFKSMILRHAGDLEPDDVVNDNGSMVNIFHNADLLSNIRKCKPLRISGVAGGERVDSCGDFHGLKVYHLPSSPANLLAQTQLEDSFRDFDYAKPDKAYHVTHNDGSKWIFERRDDLGGLRV